MLGVGFRADVDHVEHHLRHVGWNTHAEQEAQLWRDATAVAASLIAHAVPGPPPPTQNDSAPAVDVHYPLTLGRLVVPWLSNV